MTGFPFNHFCFRRGRVHQGDYKSYLPQQTNKQSTTTTKCRLFCRRSSDSSRRDVRWERKKGDKSTERLSAMLKNGTTWSFLQAPLVCK